MEATEQHGVSIKINHIQKSFGQAHILKDVNFDIHAGEFIAIVGKSGCGKSTLLRQIAGLDAPTSGSVDYDGRSQKGLNPDVRIMFQDSRLLPWKRVLKNVGLGLKKGDIDKARAALQSVGLSGKEREWPNSLSGGQQQRVALARALVRSPRLLLLDEPLGALDALTRIDMQTLIESIWEKDKFTAILVTHDVTEAVYLADRIILIEDGAVKLDKKVDLPRPRERGSAAFAGIAGDVLDQILHRE